MLKIEFIISTFLQDQQSFFFLKWLLFLITCLHTSCEELLLNLPQVAGFDLPPSLATCMGNSTLRAPWWRGDSGSTHAWNFIKSTLCFHLAETQLFLISGLPMNELYSSSINLGSFHLCSENVGLVIREWAWLCNYTLYFIFHPGWKWKNPSQTLNRIIAIREFMTRV